MWQWLMVAGVVLGLLVLLVLYSLLVMAGRWENEMKDHRLESNKDHRLESNKDHRLEACATERT